MRSQPGPPARSARLGYHQSSTGPEILLGDDLYLRTFYLMTSSLPESSPPRSTRKRKVGRSDSIRSMGLGKDHEFNVRWLREARRVLKPDGTLWVSGTH